MNSASVRKRMITSVIPALQKPMPLSDYLARRFSYLSQNQWKEEILAGRMTLSGADLSDDRVIVKGGEALAWDGGAMAEPDVDEGISILYEDEDFVAVNKTGNLPVHPAGRYFNATLTAILERRYGRRVHPVHRMDRETSGVLLLAFDGRAAGHLSAALTRGTKEYLALVHGVFPEEQIAVDWPLGADAASVVRKKRKAWPGGFELALTRFEKVLTAGEFSLVRCFPQTGRLHQIRAHLLAAGFPIVGDKLYGLDESLFLEFIETGWTTRLAERLLLPRQALHAANLRFSHPRTGRDIRLKAPVPAMMTDFISSL